MLFIEDGNTKTQLWENDEWDKKLQKTIDAYEERIVDMQEKLTKSNADFQIIAHQETNINKHLSIAQCRTTKIRITN